MIQVNQNRVFELRIQQQQDAGTVGAGNVLADSVYLDFRRKANTGCHRYPLHQRLITPLKLCWAPAQAKDDFEKSDGKRHHIPIRIENVH